MPALARKPVRSRQVAAWVLLGLAICLSQCGCVQRRMTIRSNPPGAMVYVDGYEIGTTPVSHSFIYYGQRKIQLVKDGYETLTVIQAIPAPWYQVFPLDFVTENLVPGEIRDQRTLDYQLTPQAVVPTELLLGRAEQLRRSAPQPQVNAPPPFPATAPQAQPTLPPAAVPTPVGPEPIPAPAPTMGGQPVYPLPPR